MNNASGTEKDDRRKDPRHRFSRYIFYATENSFYEGILKDYSRSGLFIESSSPLQVGEEVTVALPYIEDKDDKRKGQVVRQNEKGFGVEFFQDPNDRILRSQTLTF